MLTFCTFFVLLYLIYILFLFSLLINSLFVGINYTSSMASDVIVIHCDTQRDGPGNKWSTWSQYIFIYNIT